MDETISVDNNNNNYYHMPEDVLIDILLRLTAKSLLRFRCVSKSWYSLIHSGAFVALYCRFHSSSTPYWFATYFITQEKKDNSMKFSVHDASGSVRSLYLPSPFEGCNSVRIVGSAHGVLLCLLNDPNLGSGQSLIVWNPLMNRCIPIPMPMPMPMADTNRFRDVFGLDLDPLDDYGGYKVVMVGVYSSRSRSWRNIPLNPHIYKIEECPPTVVKGACHWDAWRCIDYTKVIVAFDFKMDKFEQISLPFNDRLYSMMAYKDMLCVGFYGDKDILYGNPYHLWVMREYGVEKSWSSLFILEADVGSLIPCFPRLVGILENGDVVMTIREEKHRTRKVNTRIVHYNPQSWPPTIEVGLLDFAQEPVACYGQSLLLL